MPNSTEEVQGEAGQGGEMGEKRIKETWRPRDKEGSDFLQNKAENFS